MLFCQSPVAVLTSTVMRTPFGSGVKMKLFAHELCFAITNAFTSQSRNIRLRWEGIAAETLPCKIQSRAYGA
jgi:hypothetical protein